jgi:hypothetical protein
MKKIIFIFATFFSLNANSQHDPFKDFVIQQPEFKKNEKPLTSIGLRPTRVVIKKTKVILYFDKKQVRFYQRRMNRHERRESRFHNH